ncbi:MAG: hypothetical protein GX146_09370 [Myxococcales bacterium]|jgi:hypothetical protein|nr:hypothetical protein [Myxococcales bacterium]
MKQQILAQLQSLSQLDTPDLLPDAALPAYRIPPDLARTLDAVLHRAAGKANLAPAVLLADLIERGIISWIADQPAPLRASLGLAARAPVSVLPAVSSDYDDDYDDEDDPDPASAQRAADAYMSGTLGYTDMTLHAVHQQRHQGQGNTRSKKKRQRNPQHAGNVQTAPPPGGGTSRSARSRRRKNNAPRTHSG